MNKTFYLLILSLSCLLTSCETFMYRNYVLITEQNDTIYVKAHSYEYNEYKNVVTFKDTWYNRLETYRNIKEIRVE